MKTKLIILILSIYSFAQGAEILDLEGLNDQETFPLISNAASHVVSATQITDLGTLGGDNSFAYAINDKNQIVGVSQVRNSNFHAFLWENGQMTDLEPFWNVQGINNSGQIVGSLTASNGTLYPAILRYVSDEDYSASFIGNLGGVHSGINGLACGINNLGQVAGFSYLPSGLNHAFLSDQTGMHDIGFFNENSVAIAINDQGTVVGVSAQKAYLYENGIPQVLEPLGSETSQANAINSQGQIVGYCVTAGQFSAFLYDHGVFTELGQGVAYSINDSSRIVGTTSVLPRTGCRQCNLEWHAFLYENGTFTDLNFLLQAGSGWVLNEAFAINNNGAITGYGSRNGQQHGFLLIR